MAGLNFLIVLKARIFTPGPMQSSNPLAALRCGVFQVRLAFCITPINKNVDGIYAFVVL